LYRYNNTFQKTLDSQNEVIPLKNISILIISLFILNPLFSQVKRPQNDPKYDFKRLHFGFTVGLNTMDFGIRRPGLGDTLLIADASRISPGFQVSIVSDLRLADYFSLRFLPGITFGQRNLYFYVNDSVLDRKMDLESSFLDFPLVVKYKSKRVNNYAPYLIGGINIRYDLAAKKGYTIGEGPYQTTYVMLKPFDIYFEIGFGIDYYLKYFKFSTELKLSAGLRDIAVGNDFSIYNNSIERLNSYLVMLCFHFE
jgi:hypothetical protein